MKRILLVLALLMAVVGGVDAKKTWKKGQAEWAKIQLNDHLTYDQAFGMVIETLSDKYELDMISKEGGYIRTAWNFLTDRKGKKIKDQQCRVTVKFNHDRTQLQVKTETQKRKNNVWIDGEDTAISTQLKEDLRGQVGL